MVNKLPDQFECPVDRVILRFIDSHLFAYHQLGLSPNMVTTLSLLTGLSAAYLLLVGRHYGLAALLYLLAYYLDCVDGKLARAYNQVTVFGDYYDHFSDTTKFMAVLYALYENRTRRLTGRQTFFQYFIVGLSVLTLLHFGYAEVIYGGNESPTLAPLKYVAGLDANPMERIQLTKYFGNGTLTLVLVLGILLWDQRRI